jgi:hypothetical protein
MKKIYEKPQVGLKHFRFIDRTNITTEALNDGSNTGDGLGAAGYADVKTKALTKQPS